MATTQAVPLQVTNLPLTEWVRKGSDARSHYASVQNELIGLLKDNPALDLTQLQLPLVQNILRRLSIAPKPKEWVLDPILRLEVRNELMIAHLIQESLIQIFQEYRQEFWRELAQHINAEKSQMMNLEMRSMHAMIVKNNQIANLLHRQNQAQLKEWRDQQALLLNDIDKSLVKIGELEAVLILQAKDAFLDACETSDVLKRIFAPLTPVQREQFHEAYLPERIKLKVKIEDDHVKAKQLEEKKQKILDRVRHFRDFAHDKKLAEVEKEIQANHTKLEKHERKQRELPANIAKQCGFGDGMCAHIHRDLKPLNQTLDHVYGPVERDLMAARRQRLHLQAKREPIRLDVQKLDRALEAPRFTSGLDKDTSENNVYNRLFVGASKFQI